MINHTVPMPKNWTSLLKRKGGEVGSFLFCVGLYSRPHHSRGQAAGLKFRTGKALSNSQSDGFLHDRIFSLTSKAEPGGRELG